MKKSKIKYCEVYQMQKFRELWQPVPSTTFPIVIPIFAQCLLPWPKTMNKLIIIMLLPVSNVLLFTNFFYLSKFKTF